MYVEPKVWVKGMTRWHIETERKDQAAEDSARREFATQLTEVNHELGSYTLGNWPVGGE